MLVELSGRLPDQAFNGANNGKLLAAARIPGGDAMVLLGPASDGSQAFDHGHESRGDPVPPLLILSTWEDDWRDLQGQDDGSRATVESCAIYLGQHLTWASQRHVAFDEFASDIRRLVGRLEDVLHDGVRDERGAPCIHCGADLVRVCTDKGGLQDVWKCPRCRRDYDWQAYHNAVAATYNAHAPNLNLDQLKQHLGVRPGTVVVWATRGKVRRCGRDGSGRMTYDVADVRHAMQGDTEVVA